MWLSPISSDENHKEKPQILQVTLLHLCGCVCACVCVCCETSSEAQSNIESDDTAFLQSDEAFCVLQRWKTSLHPQTLSSSQGEKKSSWAAEVGWQFVLQNVKLCSHYIRTINSRKQHDHCCLLLNDHKLRFHMKGPLHCLTVCHKDESVAFIFLNESNSSIATENSLDIHVTDCARHHALGPLICRFVHTHRGTSGQKRCTAMRSPSESFLFTENNICPFTEWTFKRHELMPALWKWESAHVALLFTCSKQFGPQCVNRL